ncbi:hypothetical protein [Bradyrhizobium sp. SZCCHNRI20481]|uniref:hypothetical protein n=1 Tax=Bradyrhizobium sp. SZCCHNRI20481 TaxID=3057286 RepID=UPI0029166E2E|nr:hypothetical protein [Bradyrhizobium sp. SZCCHNRI20481]
MNDDRASDLWQAITSHEALQAAWFKVASNEGSAGGDGVGIAEFGANLYANLTQLRVELLGGTYRTGPFRRVTEPRWQNDLHDDERRKVRFRICGIAQGTSIPYKGTVQHDCSLKADYPCSLLKELGRTEVQHDCSSFSRLPPTSKHQRSIFVCRSA